MAGIVNISEALFLAEAAVSGGYPCAVLPLPYLDVAMIDEHSVLLTNPVN